MNRRRESIDGVTPKDGERVKELERQSRDLENRDTCEVLLEQLESQSTCRNGPLLSGNSTGGGSFFTGASIPRRHTAIQHLQQKRARLQKEKAEIEDELRVVEEEIPRYQGGQGDKAQALEGSIQVVENLASKLSA